MPNHCIDKVLAISQLMNIAKYYNGDWNPNWKSLMEPKYYIYYNTRSNIYGVANTCSTKYGNIYFRLYKDAKAVMDNPNFRSILDAIYKRAVGYETEDEVTTDEIVGDRKKQRIVKTKKVYPPDIDACKYLLMIKFGRDYSPKKFELEILEKKTAESVEFWQDDK